VIRADRRNQRRSTYRGRRHDHDRVEWQRQGGETKRRIAEITAELSGKIYEGQSAKFWTSVDQSLPGRTALHIGQIAHERVEGH
jgi:hypothetical protein